MVLHYGQEIFEGLEGVPAAGRLGAVVPARRQRRPVPAVGPPAGDAGAARGAVPRRRSGSCSPSTARWVPTAAARLAVPAAVHDRDRGRASGCSPPRATSTCSSPRRPARTSPAGCKPVSVWLSTEYVRAAPGRHRRGQVRRQLRRLAAWRRRRRPSRAATRSSGSTPIERRWVEEMGGMNLFFVFGSGSDAQVVTPELTGSLLPGVTRDSLLQLAADLGYHGRGAPDLHRRVGEGSGRRRAHRGVRLRHGRGDHARSARSSTPAAEFAIADGQPGESPCGCARS